MDGSSSWRLSPSSAWLCGSVISAPLPSPPSGSQALGGDETSDLLYVWTIAKYRPKQMMGIMSQRHSQEDNPGRQRLAGAF